MRAALSLVARAAAGAVAGLVKAAERTAVRSASRMAVGTPTTTGLIAVRDRQQGVRVRIGN